MPVSSLNDTCEHWSRDLLAGNARKFQELDHARQCLESLQARCINFWQPKPGAVEVCLDDKKSGTSDEFQTSKSWSKMATRAKFCIVEDQASAAVEKIRGDEFRGFTLLSNASEEAIGV